VVDILPPEKLAPSPPTKWQGKTVLNNMFRVDLKNNMFRRKNSDASFKIDREYAEPDVVEEIFEDGSAMLSRRYILLTNILGLFSLGVLARSSITVLREKDINIPLYSIRIVHCFARHVH
jgi:hypothetical protein